MVGTAIREPTVLEPTQRPAGPAVAPMRIAFVTGEFPPDTGGVGDYTQHLAGALGDRGHEITVVSTAAEHDAHAGGHGDTRFEVLTTGGRPSAAGSVMTIVRSLRPGVVSFQYVPQMYGRAGIAPAIATLPLKLRREGIRVVCTMHEIASPFAPGPRRSAVALAHRLQAAVLLAGCDTVIVTNAAHGRFARRLSLGRARVHQIPVGASVLPHGDRAASAALRHEFGEAVLLAGDFSPLAVGKRPEDLIALARTAGPRARFMMMGGLPADARRRAAFIRRAEAAGVDDRFLWTGQLTSRDISRHLGALDLYVHTSHAGPTGGSTTSALAHGLPAVAYDSGDTPAYARQGGIALAAPGKTEDFVEKAAALLDDPAARSALGEGAERLHERHLSWDVIAQQAEEAMS